MNVDPRVAQLAQRLPDYELLLAEKARRSFHTFFVHYAWPVLNPGVPFVDNWHVGAICEHLEAVHSGQVKRLIINMPFRMLKSTLVSQAFPAWEWTSRPELTYLTSSYAKTLATRDAVDSRRIIESRRYQAAYGHRFRLVGDQNEKTRYENDHRGQRTTTSTDSAGTGFGGNRLIVDDPVSAKMANSPVAIAASIEWWKGTSITRLNDIENDAIIVVHQRLAVDDLTGYILESTPEGWDQLILPMRFEKEHRKTTSIGWTDPRKKEGELLMPHRIGEKACKELEDVLGQYHTEAQMQQRPNQRGGVLIDPECLVEVDEIPAGDWRWCRGWDLAATDVKNGGNPDAAWTVGGRIGFCQATNRWIIVDVQREREGPAGVAKLIKQVAQLDGSGVEIDLPQDPGQAGKSQVLHFVGMLSGYNVSYSPESGDKATRATPLSSQINAGNVLVLKRPWLKGLKDEMRRFPGGKFKDQVDALARAFNHIAGVPTLDGIIGYYQQQVEERQAAEEAANKQAQPQQDGWLAVAGE